jgi:transcriptional regulator with XRE-family HTH domain
MPGKEKLVNISFKEMWVKFANSKKYRTSFAKAQFKRLVPFQVRALRKARGWSQEQLAEHSRVTQGVISRAEDPDYGNLTVNTILSIAEGFDAVFVGRFVPFSKFSDWVEELSEKSAGEVPSFEAENMKIHALLAERENKNIPRVPEAPLSGVLLDIETWKNILRGKGQHIDTSLWNYAAPKQEKGDNAHEALSGRAG